MTIITLDQNVKIYNDMKYFFSIICALLIISCGSNSTKESKKDMAKDMTATPPAEMAAKMTSLFNGKDLSGWTNHGQEKWYVEDGILVCESGPAAEYGYLCTDKNYKNFELSLEFKQEANGNSGVFIRSTVDGTKVSGWQVEVAPPGHDTGGIYESYGRGWLIKPDPEKDKALRMGEWNTMRILVSGNNVTSYLNGTEMVNFDDEKIGAGEGGICLQIHDGGGIRVNWRNLMLKGV